MMLDTVAADTDGGDDAADRNALLVAGAPLGFPVEAGVDAAGRANPRERRTPARRRSSQRTPQLSDRARPDNCTARQLEERG